MLKHASLILLFLLLLVSVSNASVEFNSSNSWAGTSGPMWVHGDEHLRNEPEHIIGLVSWWEPGTDVGSGTTLTDLYGSNDGTITGATWNVSGGGLDYNGSSDYVDCGNSARMNITGNITIILDAISNGIQADSYASIVTKASAYTMNFDSDGDGLYWTVTISTVNKNAWIPTILQNQNVSFAGTYDNSTVRLYQNGIATGTTTSISGNIDTSVNKLFIGAYGTTGVAGGNYFNGTIGRTAIYNVTQTNDQINETNDNYHSISSYRQIDNAQDAGANQVHKYWHVEGTDPSVNTSLAIQGNVSSDNSSFSWVWINSSCNVGDNVTTSTSNEYRYLGSPAARFYSNTTYQPETNIISNITITSDIESVPVITLLSQTPEILYQNSSGTITQVWGISHTDGGLNQTSIAYTFGMYDVINDIYKFNLRTPSNNLADFCPYCEMDILRGYNRNQTLTWEGNATITGGDIYTWNGYDYYNSEITFQSVNATYTNVTVHGLVRNQVFPVSTYLDASDLKETSKTVFPIHKTSGLVIKIWDNEAFLDHEHLGFAYVDAIITGILPSDATPIEIFYLNNSFNTTGVIHPDDSPYLFYLTSMNASEWVTNDYSPHVNSSYVNSIVVNSTAIENGGIDVNGNAYLYFRSNTPSVRPYGVNMTNVACSTNVSFVDSKIMWKIVDTPFSITQEDYTPNIFTSFMHKNMQYQSKLWIQDNNSVWVNSSLETTNIEVSIFPPSAPGFDYICVGGVLDYDMDGTYFSTIGVGIGVSQDPDGGIVDHNLTLHYENKTFVAVINNTFTNEDANGGFMCVEFDTSSYYSDIDNYTMKINATDDDGDSAIQWLGVNFRLTNTPTIVDYSPNTPAYTVQGIEQEFIINANQLVNVNWYIDSVIVHSELNVNYSNYTNNTAPVDNYNVTVVIENINGSSSFEWSWYVYEYILVDGYVTVSSTYSVTSIFGVLVTTSESEYDVTDANGYYEVEVPFGNETTIIYDKYGYLEYSLNDTYLISETVNVSLENNPDEDGATVTKLPLISSFSVIGVFILSCIYLLRKRTQIKNKR